MEMTKRVVACVLLLVAVAYAVIGLGRAQVSCSNVDSVMGPCAQYLTGQANAPSAQCCSGVRSIHQAAGNTQARRDTCECLRQIAARYSNLRDEAAQALPGLCGVSVGIPISRNTDCSRTLYMRLMRELLPEDSKPMRRIVRRGGTSASCLEILPVGSFSQQKNLEIYMDMTKSGITCALLLVLAAAYAAVEPAPAEVIISCSTVDAALAPCTHYLTGQENPPSAECCGGVLSTPKAAIRGGAQTRRETCESLHQVAARYGDNLRDETVTALPGRCGLHVDTPFSLRANCSR
ncbi:hypothetical protein QJS10_CPA09g00670 [Acorus calamus]|uniref:Non-specific lipid-transfer protein n=1 Tax=Acorus calamus TaxID=4465 RepID=A0AAV9E5Y5_ACOCL|nr:hypothetical protein QJS10_CPA09g00670 [Acorus calamus]